MERTLSGDGRLVELEAVRGVAALVVLIHHLCLGFFPRLHGLLFPGADGSLFGTPLFAVVNGSAAVAIFFVLSGFVLTVQAFQHRSVWPLLRGAVKRWPRLALPVLIVSIGAGVLDGWDLYANAQAATLTGSSWLGWFYRLPGTGWEMVWRSANEGLLTFFTGAAYFNSSLWTMQYEFFGSFFAFALAGAMIVSDKRASLALALLGVAATLAIHAHFLSFAIGVALAAFYASAGWAAFARWLHTCPAVVWAGVIALLVYLLGYHETMVPPGPPIGAYEFLKPLYSLSPSIARAGIHSLAGAMIILIVLGLRPGWLAGKFGAVLGRMSFPIYLIHVPVICSAGAWIVVLMSPTLGVTPSSFMAIAVSIALTAALAVPLAALDVSWTKTLRSGSPGSYREAKRGRQEDEETVALDERSG